MIRMAHMARMMRKTAYQGPGVHAFPCVPMLSMRSHGWQRWHGGQV
jgi:hypothetical protein